MAKTYDLNDMMTFLSVVEAGSFTQAAERLGIPKANVSRKVTKLEQQLGTVLLERTTRSQRLTEAGGQFLTHCKRISEEINLAHSAVNTIKQSISGNLKIGTSVTMGQQVLKNSLAQFMKMYPEVKLHLSLLNQRVDLIEQGYDVLIRIGELSDSRLIAKPLGHIKRHIYASSEYLKNNTNELTELTDLSHHSILHMSPDNRVKPLNLYNSDTEERVQLSLPYYFLSDDFEVIKQLTMEHCGIALLPTYMTQGETKTGQLQRVLPNWQAEQIPVYVLYPKHRSHIAKVAQFINHIEKSFAQYLSH